MSKTITRKYIQRITKREGNTSIRQSSGGGGGGGASQYWVEENYISKLFFNQLFTVYDEDGNIVEPNDTESVIASIKSMFGFWTDAYLSALGNNPGGGGAELTLASLADVDVHGVADGQALVWNATIQKWVPGQGGGIDITAMWAALAQSGTQQIDVSHLGTALTGYATETWVGNQGYITSSALNGYATESWVGSQISDMATKTWVSGNYLSQTDAAATYVSIAFFERLFKAYNDSTVVHPNNTTSTIDNIKAMFGFWTEQYISALGKGSSGESGGVTMAQVWSALGNSTTEQINISHLTTALSGYNPTSNFKTINGNSIIGTGDIVIQGGGGTVTSIKVGTTSYSPTDGVVSLPAYPTDADTLDGYHASVDNAPFGKIPVINPNGFMEVGNSFEMHYDNSGSLDYSTRLYCTGDYQNSVALPSDSGTLALTTDNVASATKLQTPRTIWGQNFDGTSNVTGSFWLGDSTGNRFYVRSQISGESHLHSGFLYDTADNEAFVFCTGYLASRIVFYNNTPLDLYAGRDYLTKTPALCIYDGRVSINKLLPDTGYNLDVDGAVRASSFVKLNGTSSQFLKADGSVDSNTYALSSSLSGYLPLSGGTMSNTNLVTNLNAQYLNGYGPYNGTNSGYVFVGEGNFCEMGTHIEFHYDKTSGLDYSTILRCTGNHRNIVELPSAAGTLALTTDNVASATKLQTPRTIWGQNFDGTGNVSGAITGATTINASSNVSVGGTLGVTGATTLSSTLSVSGTSTLTGHVGIGTAASSSYALKVSGVAYASIGVYSAGYVTALSDIRHKNIQGDVGLTVSEVANAPAVKFLWKDRRQDGLQVGSIAQYWQKVLPEAIVEAADGELTMSYGVIALLASIATARKVEDLERRVNLLEQENRLLKEQLKIS